jgi:hypothetical protein
MVLALGTSAFAAEPTYGVEAGVNLGSFKLSGGDADQIDVGRKVGLLAGVFATIPASDNVSIQIEAAYSQKKAGLKDKQTGGTLFDITEKVTVIDIPVLAHFNLQPMKTPGFYIVAGPQISIKLSAKQKDEKSGAEEDDNGVKSTDFALVGGVGVMLGPQFGIEARYGWGLVNLNDQAGDSTSVKSQTITVLGRYSFGPK